MFFQRGGKIKFQLTYGESVIPHPTSRKIASYLKELNHENDSFLILEPEESIQDTTFLQAALPKEGFDDGWDYMVGLGVTKNGRNLLYEYRTHDLDEVISLFTGYFEKQEIPAYSCWVLQMF